MFAVIFSPVKVRLPTVGNRTFLIGRLGGDPHEPPEYVSQAPLLGDIADLLLDVRLQKSFLVIHYLN